MRSGKALFALVGLAVGLLAASRLPLHAQKPPLEASPATAAAKPSIQEALLRPYEFDFAGPTTLDELTRRLSADLGGEVVLDVAALDRLDLEKGDTVELGLKSARLKTGLKLLLDQVELTYRLVPEDNLMILTDQEGSEDPLDRIWTELSEIHREIHDIRDAVDELLDYQENAADLQYRQPTIIEELPATPGVDPVPPGEDSAPAVEPPAPARRPRT